MIKKFVKFVFLAWALLMIAVCLPILATLRLIGMVIYKAILFVSYIILYPTNFDVTEWEWRTMKWEYFDEELEDVDFSVVVDYYKNVFNNYILRKNQESKKSIRVEE